MTYQKVLKGQKKVAKSQQKFRHQSVKMSSHRPTSIRDYCNSIPISQFPVSIFWAIAECECLWECWPQNSRTLWEIKGSFITHS